MMNNLKSAIKNVDTIFKKTEPTQNQTDDKLSIEDIIFLNNYPLEIHNVETEDGYTLKLYRIPGGKHEKDYKTTPKHPILLQHGLLDSSDAWICNDEDKCIPFILANKGFDIWLGNSRGNKHSKHHKILSPLTKEFWCFSFHEMGTRDLPAVIDHILKINKNYKKIIYIGHSQGTCMLFSALTLKLDYFKEKIKLFIALAPVAKLDNMKSGFLKFLKQVKSDFFLKMLNQYEVFPGYTQDNTLISWINKNMPFLSNKALEMISDENISTLNNNFSRLDVYLSHFPSGTSLQALNHFLQIYENKSFQQYDFELEANMRIYGTLRPTVYNLKNIKNIPIVLLGGKEDKLANEDDVKWLIEELKETVIYFEIFEKMGHLTFLLSKDMEWFKYTMDLIEVYRDLE